MPPVQLVRLRPQVNTLMTHYQDEGLFEKTLLLIFEKYTEKRSATNAWLRPDPGMPSYNLSPLVMNELENAFEALSKLHPAEAIRLADHIWQQPYYEPKRLAIILLASLPPENREAFFQRIEQWIPAGLQDCLISELIEHISILPRALSSERWIDLVRTWLYSDDKNLVKVGMRAVSKVVENPRFQNLPRVFDLLEPLYAQPRIDRQKNLTALTRTLIERSQPETAAFLISLVEIHQKANVSALVRKLMPLFDTYYQDEIRKVVF